MKKLLLIFIMMATWMVVGCETVRQIKTGCFGYWIESNDGHKKGTRWSNKNSNRPYRQCVENEPPYKNTEKRSQG
jgi:uncharacterized protein YxeA